MSPSCRAAYHILRVLLAMSVFALVTGCGTSPPKPTVIAASVEAAPDLNPDSKGRPSPIVVRLFELKSVAAFDAADFFSLWDRERETLTAELVDRDEFQLRPSEQKSFERTLQADTRYVAVIAAFRDLERAQWRGAVAVAPHHSQPITIRLGARNVTVSAR